MNNLFLQKETWLVTGAAGFIGSNLVEELLKNDQEVIGLDDFSTGHTHNLEDLKDLVGEQKWKNFNFIEGDIRNFSLCQKAMQNVDRVLHQAALGSVPRSLKDPITTNEVNVSGFLNMLKAAQEKRVASFVYAASSSTYGDHPGLPKVEDLIGKPLSPYAVTKYVNELYANVFQSCYGFKATGLRYFNVFGRRQDPYGAYAAVIPLWIASMMKGEPVYINGDGETSRDFCFIENVIQANINASFAPTESQGHVYNIAFGERTTLNELHTILADGLESLTGKKIPAPHYRDFRPGDVRHSLANIGKARELISYAPKHSVKEGLLKTMEWYLKNL